MEILSKENKNKERKQTIKNIFKYVQWSQEYMFSLWFLYTHFVKNTAQGFI